MKPRLHLLAILAVATGFWISGPGCATSMDHSKKAGPTDFLAAVFSGIPPEAQYLWITPEIRRQIEQIGATASPDLRIPYWQKKEKTVWILTDTVKGEPVSVGIVIDGRRISKLQVLSGSGRHGARLATESFTNQFRSAGLTQHNGLDQPIDAVTGATYSARAVSRLARQALVLDRIAVEK